MAEERITLSHLVKNRVIMFATVCPYVFAVLCFFVVFLGGRFVSANDSGALLVLGVAGEGSGAARVRRFTEELSLTLEQMPVRLVIPPGSRDFFTLSSTEQIKIVRMLSAQKNAPAVVWISESGDGVLLLHMVAIRTGRAMIRLLKSSDNAGFEKDLALAAAELLGTLYLFNTPPKGANNVVAKAINNVRKKTSPPVRQDKTFAFSAAGRVEAGALGGAGPRWFGGGAISLEASIADGLFMRLNTDVGAGPIDVPSYDADLKTLSVAPGLGVLYLWERGRWLLGPALDFQLCWTQASVKIRGETKQAVQTLQVRATTSLEARRQVFSNMSILIGAGAVVTPQQDSYRLKHTHETIFATWNLGLSIKLGLIFYWHPKAKQ